MEFYELYPVLKEYANEFKTPIIMEDALLYIKELIKEKRVLKILEIGTAIAYSALHFVSVDENIKLDTVERNSDIFEIAKANVLEYDKHQQINLHFGDALEYPLENLSNNYDLLFIDAAKAQSQKFFERYLPLLKEDAIIVTDNMNFHDVDINDPTISKNLKNMLKKIAKYHDWLVAHPDFETKFVDLGDGLAITKRRN